MLLLVNVGRLQMLDEAAVGVLFPRKHRVVGNLGTKLLLLLLLLLLVLLSGVEQVQTLPHAMTGGTIAGAQPQGLGLPILGAVGVEGLALAGPAVSVVDFQLVVVQGSLVATLLVLLHLERRLGVNLEPGVERLRLRFSVRLVLAEVLAALSLGALRKLSVGIPQIS